MVNATASNSDIFRTPHMRGNKLGMARHGEHAFEIARILMVGVETEDGISPVRPAVYFSLFGVKEYAV
jgi:hypothetical protein